jgi:hypothetical protein
LTVLFIVYVWNIDDDDLDYDYDEYIPEVLGPTIDPRGKELVFQPRELHLSGQPRSLVDPQFSAKLDGINPRRNIYQLHEFGVIAEESDTTENVSGNSSITQSSHLLINVTEAPENVGTPEPEILKPPGVERWQTVDEYRSYVFSAHRDPRHPSRTIVFVFGIMLTRLLRDRVGIRLYCHLVTAEFGIIDTVLGKIRTLGLRQYK